MEQVKAGVFLLEKKENGGWLVSIWCTVPYLDKSTCKLIGEIKIPAKKIKKFLQKPHSGACEASVRAMLKEQLNIVHF